MTWVPLRVHSCFSILAGADRVERIVAVAAAAGLPALALADTDALHGVVPFRRACREAGVRPVYGAELTGPWTAGEAGTETPGYPPGRGPAPGGARATLLARDAAGYAAISRLVTRRRCDGEFLLPDALRSLGDDVVVLTDDERVARLLAGRPWLRIALPTAAGPAWKRRRWRLRRLAAATGAPVVAAGEVWFVDRGDHLVHRVLSAIRTRTTIGTLPDGAAAPRESFLPDPAAVARVFADDPAAAAEAGRVAAACRCELDLDRRKLPRFSLPPGETAAAVLRRLARRGLRRRLAGDGPVERRRADETLERELAVVEAKDLADYFLVCWDIVRFARSRGMRSLGRGSAGNSIVSYALEITHVNPLRHDLFFERFLNPEREQLPDIDLDFATDDREEILAYIFRRYGRDRVAMIGAFSTLRARAALRETAKALGIPEGETAPLIRRIPRFADIDRLEEVRASVPAAADLPLEEEPLRTLVPLAARIGRFPRHMSTHPCGLVVSPGPVTDLVPLQLGDRGLEIAQWSMYEIEEAGLLKIDVIGQKGLAVIQEAAAAAERHAGRPLHPERIDCVADPATRAAMRRGETEGCFYVESPIMIQLIRQARCDDFEVLTALSSIIRPGVSSHGGKQRYLRRHLGLEPVAPMHPAVAAVLADTRGVLIYQEQVIRIAVAVAGMSHAEADGLRRCMSFKSRGETFAAYRDSFMRGARRRGIGRADAEEIFEAIASFAGYAFCKAHSASFALESFESLYWKTHYPAEFMAAVLSNGGGYYTAEEYVEEARRMGLGILPPCVNRGGVRFEGEGRRLRVGLMQVKGLSAGTAKRIVERRPFLSLAEFLEKTGASRGEAESLVRCGAAATLGASRPVLLWELRVLLSGEDPAPLLARLPRLSDYGPAESLAIERELLGLAVGAHPLAIFEGAVAAARREANAVFSTDLPPLAGREAAIVGWKASVSGTRTQKTGEQMLFVTFSDERGRFEAIFFPRVYRRAARLLASGPGPFLVRGRVETDLGAENLVATDVEGVC